MTITRNISFTFAVMLLIVFLASSVQADWNPGDQHKMHYPQLPDPTGWDVGGFGFIGSTPASVLADDWQCSQSGPVNDIHIWGSWKSDLPGTITALAIGIYSDIPRGPDVPYSRPGEPLWQGFFDPDQFSVIPYGQGEQGWYAPETDLEYTLADHTLFHQINIENITDPFVQQEGTIYWLSVAVSVETSTAGVFEWGWKTSRDYWNDGAVWLDLGSIGSNPTWEELRDPITEDSLDLAFVITPEPATLGLLLVGGLALLRRRW